MPLRAANAEEIEVVNGIAKPSAWGQEITSTVTTRTTASSVSPSATHTMAVIDGSGGGDVEEQCGGPVGEHLGA